MLLILKEDNLTGSFYLSHLLCVLSEIIKSSEICTGVHLHIQLLYLQMAQWCTCVPVCYWSLHVHYTIGYMCINWGMHTYVDSAKLQIISMLLFTSYNIDTTPKSGFSINWIFGLLESLFWEYLRSIPYLLTVLTPVSMLRHILKCVYKL